VVIFPRFAGPLLRAGRVGALSFSSPNCSPYDTHCAPPSAAFIPTPSQSRELFASSYSVPSTLLVRFSDDSIDETSLVAPLLQAREAVVVKSVLLRGTHLTPCGGDVNWQVRLPLDTH